MPARPPASPRPPAPTSAHPHTPTALPSARSSSAALAALLSLPLLGLLMLGLLMLGTGSSAGWAQGSPAPAQSTAAASPAPSSVDPPPAPATLSRATGTPDLWEATAPACAGWLPGDRVQIVRGASPQARAVVTRVEGATLQLLLEGSSTTLIPGDTVVFTRRRKALPQAATASSSQRSRPRQASSGGTSSSGESAPSTGIKELGTVEGLLGNDWLMCDTRYCRAYVRKGNFEQVRAIIDGLDASAAYNTIFMGTQPTSRMSFYFCPLDSPGHTQPAFKKVMARYTRVAGLAISGMGCVVINLGNWRTGYYLEPWDVEVTCRHEMNHLLAFIRRGADRLRTWSWLAEALAHTAEDTVRPASAQLDLAAIKSYMAGYRAVDASFSALIDDRNNDNLEQYRDYSKLLVSIIYYLQDSYGSDVVARLMRATSGHDIEDAFVAVTGKGTRDIEAEWRSYYGVR